MIFRWIAGFGALTVAAILLYFSFFLVLGATLGVYIIFSDPLPDLAATLLFPTVMVVIGMINRKTMMGRTMLLAGVLLWTFVGFLGLGAGA